MDGVKHRDGIKVIYHLLLKKKNLAKKCIQKYVTNSNSTYC